MAAPLAEAFMGAPAQAAAQFKSTMGVTFELGGQTVTPLLSISILLASAAVFYALTLWRVSRKRKG